MLLGTGKLDAFGGEVVDGNKVIFPAGAVKVDASVAAVVAVDETNPVKEEGIM
jgi:hypothetical protein